ncbi:MAG TPA: hypothetical protein VF875_03015 [Anaeromyxobacter sp.]
MARKDRRTRPEGRLRELLEAGDHRGARAEARGILADCAAPEASRAEAAAALASLAPDRAVVAAGLAAIAIAVALSIWTVVAG